MGEHGEQQSEGFEGALHRLTDRQRQVADLMARGRTNKQIKAEAKLSRSRVNDLVRLVLVRFEVRDRRDFMGLYWKHWDHRADEDTRSSD